MRRQRRQCSLHGGAWPGDGIDYARSVGDLLVADAPRGYVALLNRSARVLIYSGDLDAQVPHGGTEAWTRGLGYAVKETWRPWSVDGAVAGNVVEYDVGGAGQFLFATVRGAGHMAPTFQPRSAQVMIARFVNGTAL